MITKYSFSTVWVLDQDSAKTFYTEKLGFEVRSDQTMDGLRWLTVGPKTPRALYFNDDVYVGFCLRGRVLEVSAADPAIGTAFYTLDQEPADRPYGVEAVFRDDSGNWYSLTERKGR